MGKHSRYKEPTLVLTSRGWFLVGALLGTMFLIGLVGNWAFLADWR